MDNNILLNKIDELYDEYLSVWEDVCNIESPTSYKEGVDQVGEYFIRLAKKFGWDVDILEQEVSGNAVCITMNKSAKNPPIAFSGHMDTVHPLGTFGKPAVKISDKYIYGPGVADCKGGVVVGFMTMHALYECGFTDRPIMLLLQSDEETNSLGSNKVTINYICEKAKDCIAFFNLEPYVKGKACLERKGILKYIFNVVGEEAHASICATHGANAIAEAAHKIIEIEKMKDAFGITCNVGVIKGGSVSNTVAGDCRFEVDVRFTNQVEMKRAENQLKEIAVKRFIDGCNTTLIQESSRVAMELCDKNLELLDKINKILSKNGLDTLTASKSGGGSDAAYVTTSGIPCIDSLGVECSAIHTPQEKAVLSSLKESAKRLCLIINCF